MRTESYLPSLQTLIRQRLSALGATHLPAGAMTAIERDVLRACTRAVERAITAPRVGRAVAVALAAPAAKGQGFEGGTPSTSAPWRGGHESVAGPTVIPGGDQSAEGDLGGTNPEAGDGK